MAHGPRKRVQPAESFLVSTEIHQELGALEALRRLEQARRDHVPVSPADLRGSKLLEGLLSGQPFRLEVIQGGGQGAAAVPAGSRLLTDPVVILTPPEPGEAIPLDQLRSDIQNGSLELTVIPAQAGMTDVQRK